MPLTRLNLSVTTENYNYRHLCESFLPLLCFPIAPRVIDNVQIVGQTTNFSKLCGDASQECRRSIPLINYQGTTTFTFHIKLLVNFCFYLPLSCRGVQVSSLGRLALDDFFFVRGYRLKFCYIIPSVVNLQ